MWLIKFQAFSNRIINVNLIKYLWLYNIVYSNYKLMNKSTKRQRKKQMSYYTTYERPTNSGSRET